MKRKINNINEEVERIKSLFNEDRLFGNLVNETCDDLNDAINFLSTQGYSITKDTDNPCLGTNSDLKRAQDILKSYGSTIYNYRIDPTKYGCRLKIYNKNTSITEREGSIYMINLYEGTNSKQFTAYYMLTANDACNKGYGGLTTDVYDFTIGASLFKIRYIKIWGTWEVDGNEIKLKNSEVDAILNDKQKEVTRNYNFDFMGSNFDITIGKNQPLFTKNGDKNNCGLASELLNYKLSWFTLGTDIKLKDVINNF